ncbi:hypothetical protein [Bradyrhizobium sp.]|uniref:hypothetical protein n=1 Tax=Bradyrhizobium sp. TaxID=376 RepID=UPI0025BD36E7|nr:hypothetical protein [Bradyrhizobium sp.]
MTFEDFAVRSLLQTTLQLMDAAIRRASRRCSGSDLKTFNFALDPRNTLFQPKHVLAARIVHA